MPNAIFPQFNFPTLPEIVGVLEQVFVIGFLLILLLFAIQGVQQVRLLNRFLQTIMAPVWTLLSWLLLVAVVLVGFWYIVS
jgi:hypothetical protein